MAAQVRGAHAYYSEDQNVDEATADAEDEAQLVFQIITCLDKVVLQLQKHIAELHSYHDEAAENSNPTTGALESTKRAVQPKITHILDVCMFIGVDHAPLLIEQKDTLMQSSRKLRANMLLAVFAHKLLIESSYTSGYRQHCLSTLWPELERTGPQSAALPMLMKPLLPRSWKAELNHNRLLKVDEDTDLFSRDVAQEDILISPTEEGTPFEHDVFMTMMCQKWGSVRWDKLWPVWTGATVQTG